MAMSTKHFVTVLGGVEVFVTRKGLRAACLERGTSCDGDGRVWGDYFAPPFRVWWHNRRPIRNTRTHQCPDNHPYEWPKRRRFS